VDPRDGWARALAAASVVVHHANGATIQNWALGSMGVGIFFAISGFFAYYVLANDEQKLGHVDYRFYLTRRAFRIWPAYLAIIGFVSVVRWHPPDPHLFTFTINFEMALWRGWPAPELAPLWSIAVEEQFYALAPVIYHVLKSRHAWTFCLTVVVLSNVGRWLYVVFCNHEFGNGGLLYMTFAYIDTFVIGAVVAHLYLKGWRPPLAGFVAVLAILLDIALARIWAPFPPYNWFSAVPYLLLPLAGALTLLAALNQEAVISFLSLPPLRALGILSYSIYLVHVVALTEAGRFAEPSSLVFNTVAISFTLLFAIVLYFSVDRNFQLLKQQLAPDALGIWPAFISITAIASGLVMLVA
jgi:peptidoglycan/LPS O-acetylase OafA/YrhL